MSQSDYLEHFTCNDSINCNFKAFVNLIYAFMWYVQVFDCRKVNTTQEMFQALLEHIKFATNGGNLR